MNTVGKIFLSLFLSIFLLAGLFFTAMIVRNSYRIILPRTWQKVDCVILSSQVRKAGHQYRFQVEYEYEFQGKRYTSTRYARKYKGSGDYGDARGLVKKYRPESSSVCFVNPSNPSEAVLEHKTPWMILGALFSLIFVAVGGGGIYFVWRGGILSRTGVQSDSISDTASRIRGRWWIYVFFSIFLVAGLGGFGGMFVGPVVKIIDAMDWIETPCVILSSRVRSHEGSEDTTYSVDILYQYEIDGKAHKSNRYHFMAGSTSGHDSKREIVREHRRGVRTVCYVNPDDPTDAVLARGPTRDLFFGLIPFVFALVGGGGIYYTAKGGFGKKGIPSHPYAGIRAGDPTRAGPVPGLPDIADSHGPLKLKPDTSRFGKVGMAVFIAVFWNGITAVFVWKAVESWLSGRPEYLLSVFVIPFVLLGLGLIGKLGQSLLELANPRVHLTLGSGFVRIGESVDLEWRVSGRAQMIQDLQIYLEGKEEADYTRGSDLCTDEESFSSIHLAHMTNPLGMITGSTVVSIPPDTVHSFRSDNNRIIWSIHVKGDIGNWPDIDEEFEIHVMPVDLSWGDMR